MFVNWFWSDLLWTCTVCVGTILENFRFSFASVITIWIYQNSLMNCVLGHCSQPLVLIHNEMVSQWIYRIRCNRLDSDRLDETSVLLQLLSLLDNFWLGLGNVKLVCINQMNFVPVWLTCDMPRLPTNTNQRNDHIQQKFRFLCPIEFPVLFEYMNASRAPKHNREREEKQKKSLKLAFNTYLNIKIQDSKHQTRLAK